MANKYYLWLGETLVCKSSRRNDARPLAIGFLAGKQDEVIVGLSYVFTVESHAKELDRFTIHKINRYEFE